MVDHINDPSNPSQSIGSDGSFRVTLDETTAPTMTVLRDHVRKLLREATTLDAQPQAVADAFETVLVGLQWLEYRQGLGTGATVDD